MFEAAIFLLSACAVVAEPSHGVTDKQLDNLYVSIEVTPKDLRLGDVVFTRITIINRGKEPVRLRPGYSRHTNTIHLSLVDPNRGDTRITLRPNDAGDVFVQPGAYRELKPGERWLIGYDLLKIPRLECTKWPFWNPRTLSKYYTLSSAMSPARGSHLRFGNMGPSLSIRPRPEAEMAKLLHFCRNRPTIGKKKPSYFEDISRPNMVHFGFWIAPLQSSLPKNLAILEETLSPGSMRDIVHITRLTQAVYDEQDVEQKRKNLDTMLDWLGDRPEIERKWMAEQVIRWARGIRGAGLFPYEIGYGATLLPPITDQDRKACREFRQSLLTHHPEATDDLNAIEERRKASRIRFEEIRKRRKRKKDRPVLGDDPFGDERGILLETSPQRSAGQETSPQRRVSRSRVSRTPARSQSP